MAVEIHNAIYGENEIFIMLIYARSLLDSRHILFVDNDE